MMSHSEAFVETLASRGVTNCFGIVGSAFMDALDLFPSAGIRFISVQHEQNAAHMADGYARVTGRQGVCIAQNGPGISNFVTGMAAAYWCHSPVVAITPEASSATKGHGGFQEVGLGGGQLSMFEAVTKYQADVNNPLRLAELTGRALDYARLERGPTQLNIPRDYFYGESECEISPPLEVAPPSCDPESVDRALALLQAAQNPVILAGGGVVMGEATEEVKALAERLGAPVATTYLHNDAFPSDHPLWCGPLGYQGSRAAMRTLRQADVVLALGTRLGPFGTLPQYGEAYWPETAKVIQVDINPRALGLTQRVDVALHGDAKKAAKQLMCCDVGEPPSDRQQQMLDATKHVWERELADMATAATDRIAPRAALRELQEALPDDVIVSTDIGNICSVANSYLRFTRPRSFLAAMSYGNCGYALPAAMGAKVAAPERPVVAYVGDGAWGMSMSEVLTCLREKIPVTVVVFNNGQWGAEKKNQVLWFGDRYIGTQLENPSFAEVAEAMGAKGLRCRDVADVGRTLKAALQNQKEGFTTVIEIEVSKELGDPFRRDAMALPKRLLPQYAHLTVERESETGQPIA